MHIGVITFKKVSVFMCMNSGQYLYFDINSLKTPGLVNMNSYKYIELSCKGVGVGELKNLDNVIRYNLHMTVIILLCLSLFYEAS